MLLYIVVMARILKFIDNCNEEFLRRGNSKDCIQTDVNNPLHHEIDIMVKDRRHWQNISVIFYLYGRVGYDEDVHMNDIPLYHVDITHESPNRKIILKRRTWSMPPKI